MVESRNLESQGAGFRAALLEEKPLQVAGAINAYTARLAEATGFRALYLSGGGVAANSLGMPDLGHQHHGRRADRCAADHRCHFRCRFWSISIPAGAARSTSPAPSVP